MANNGGWAVVRHRQSPENVTKCFDIVAVHLYGCKIERPPFVRKGLKILNVSRWASRLDFIVVDHGSQVGKAVFACAHRRFPHRSLINLTVAKYDNYAAVAFLHAHGERSANSNGQSVAESAGRRLDAWHFARFWMAAKDRIATAKGIECVERKEPLVSEHHIERNAAMALAQDH